MLQPKKLFPALALISALIITGCSTQTNAPLGNDAKNNSQNGNSEKTENIEGMDAESAAAFVNQFYEKVLTGTTTQFESDNKKIIEEMKAAGIDVEATEPPTDEKQLSTAEQIIKKYTPFADYYYISDNVDDLTKIEIYNKLTTDVYATKDLGAPTSITLSSEDITVDKENRSASFELGSVKVAYGDAEFEEQYSEAMAQRGTVIVLVWVDGEWLFDSESLLESYEVPTTDDANNGSVTKSPNGTTGSDSETE